jgi:CDP-4-dehydro-6-deoxyglucose reductase, E3
MRPVVVFDGEEHTVEPGETVLETLERNGQRMPSSCRSGTCHTCLLRAVHGTPGEQAQRGLKDTLRASGYFLACQCRPDSDLAVALPGDDVTTPARIRAVEWIGHRTLGVRLRVLGDLDYRAGQFVTLVRSDLTARSYSLASLPEDGEMYLHVRHYPDGVMSGWLAARARPGDPVSVWGPYGECFYVPGRPEQPMLLAGTGTGLAPLYGIVRDALRHGHTGPIHLVHGAADVRGLYLVDELLALAARVPTFHYHRCVLRGPADEHTAVGDLTEVTTGLVAQPAGYRVFLCGDPDTTRILRRTLFMNGASHRDIHVDAFTPPAPQADVRSAPA